ncbi:hypothetical protein AURDEDRAFT_187432 [Auricularia subglabra TFB-10046 SS5]|nr:hypothetical protein AURDEDRAFT_187432 [Auricularia subglabra TFB-10046 SS5]
MPFYTVYYPASLLTAANKQEIAGGITAQHAAITGAPTSAAKIVFIPVAPEDSFSNGQLAPFVRLVGLIKGGRDADTRARLLGGLTKVFAPFLDADVVELTLIENRLEDTVRYAGGVASQEQKEWAAHAPPRNV